MERRLFIAINLPETIKAQLRQEIGSDNKKSSELYKDARMIPEEDWHITVKFLGDQLAEHLGAIEHAMRAAVEEMTAPQITMQTLTTAPPHRPPRMVWITTTSETNQFLRSIKEAIERNLATQGMVQKGEVHQVYHGHINLARLPEGRKIADHIISFPSALTFKPATIDLMESHLESTGAEYAILKSIDFKPSI